MEIKHKGIAYDLEVLYVNRGNSVTLHVQTENESKEFVVSVSGDISEDEWDQLVYDNTLNMLPDYAGGYMEEINEWVFNTEVTAIVSEVVKRALEARDGEDQIHLVMDIATDVSVEVYQQHCNKKYFSTTFEGDSYEEIYNKLYY